MPEPTVIVAAVFSALTAILKVAQQGAHFAEVSKEVTQLQINIQLADDSINTALRLIRLKGHYLDNELLGDVSRSISHTETILKALRDGVEGCRKDLETKGSVGLKNRTSWVVFKNYEFLSKLATLTNALNALNRDISRMENAKMPEVNLPPPLYTENANLDGGITGRINTVRGFPRSPTMRRQLQRKRSQRSLHSIAPDGHDGLEIDTGAAHSLRPSSSTFSFASSANTADRYSEQLQSDDGLIPVSSAPAVPYQLPGSLSLGYGSECGSLDTPGGDYMVEDWERDEGERIKLQPMMPPPVPPKPKTPRRRSNLI